MWLPIGALAIAVLCFLTTSAFAQPTGGSSFTSPGGNLIYESSPQVTTLFAGPSDRQSGIGYLSKSQGGALVAGSGLVGGGSTVTSPIGSFVSGGSPGLAEFAANSKDAFQIKSPAVLFSTIEGP